MYEGLKSRLANDAALVSWAVLDSGGALAACSPPAAGLSESAAAGLSEARLPFWFLSFSMCTLSSY
jgi:hypothetical protein